MVYDVYDVYDIFDDNQCKKCHIFVEGRGYMSQGLGV